MDDGKEAGGINGQKLGIGREKEVEQGGLLLGLLEDATGEDSITMTDIFNLTFDDDDFLSDIGTDDMDKEQRTEQIINATRPTIQEETRHS